jgi:ABC-type polar amino acid transport system ATPase subunit
VAKTTLMRMLELVETPTEGQIFLDGVVVPVPPNERPLVHSNLTRISASDGLGKHRVQLETIRYAERPNWRRVEKNA